MPKYTMPDGNLYDFSSDAEATEAMGAWDKQFGGQKPEVPYGLGGAIAGGIGAGIDFVAPANLAVPGLIEGARAMVPEFMGGISAEQAAQNITTGNIPGTDFPYSELQPTKLLERFSGQKVNQAALDQANKPLHALTELADYFGTKATEATGSPLLGTLSNLSAATLALGGVNAAAVRGGKAIQDRNAGKTGDPKLDAAKAESDARLQAEELKKQNEIPLEYDPGFAEGNIAKDRAPLEMPPVEFPLQPKTPTRPLYNEMEAPIERPTPVKTSTEIPAIEMLGKEIDESGVRNPYLQGDRNVNVEADSISGRPIFPEDVIASERFQSKFPDGPVREAAGVYIPGENGYRLNPEYIAERWRTLRPETKERYNLRTAEDFQNFVELHERQHFADQRENGSTLRKGEVYADAERRINSYVREQYEPFVKQETPPVEAYAKDEPGYWPPNVSLADYAAGMRGKPGDIGKESLTPAQLRARLEQNLRTQSSIASKLRELEDRVDTLSETGKLQKKKAVIDSIVDSQEAAIAKGEKMGVSFKPKRSKLGGVGKKQGGALDVGELVKVLWDFAERIPNSPITTKIKIAFKNNDLPTLQQLVEATRSFTANSYQEAKALFGQKGRFWVDKEGKFQKVEQEHDVQALREYPQQGKYANEEALKQKIMDGEYVRISGEMIDHNGKLNENQRAAIDDYMRNRTDKSEFVMYDYSTGKYSHVNNPHYTHVLGGVGKKQGGSINFGFSEFLIDTLSKLPKNIKEIFKAWVENSGEKLTSKNIGELEKSFLADLAMDSKYSEFAQQWNPTAPEILKNTERKVSTNSKESRDFLSKVTDGLSEDNFGSRKVLEAKRIWEETKAFEDAGNKPPGPSSEFYREQYEKLKAQEAFNSKARKFKSQRGSWTPFAKGDPSLKAFAEHIGRDITDPVTKELYNKYYGKDVKIASPEEAAIAKIPGLKETVSPELQPLETMLERWKTETDLSSAPSARALRENLSSGGRMTAMRTGNSFIDWNVENILGETRRAQVVIKTLQNKLKGEVNKITGGLMAELRGKNEGTTIFIEAMNAMLKSEGKNEIPQGIHPEAKKLTSIMRNTLDDLGKKIQAELASQGIEGFKWRPNYLAGVFFGPYRSLVKDATGKTIGVIAGRTKAEATAAVDFIKETMPDVTFDLVEYNPKWDQGPGSLGARYGKASEVLELLKNQDEAAQLLQDNLSAYYSKVQENYMGYKQHFKKKTGVFGSEGSRPWENARNNAYDLLEAQLGVIDHGYHWLAEQKLMKDMERILTDSEIALPESKRYVTEYLDHAFGRTTDKVAVFNDAMDFTAQLLGIAPSAFKEMSSIARNTALTGTLGVSGGFVLTQLVQVPQALSVGFARAIDSGVKGGSRTGSAMLGGMDLMHGIAGKLENMSDAGRYFFEHFTKNGVMDPHLIEHTIHRKIVTTTGMNPIQKALWGSVNGAFKGAEAISGLIGKYSIERPEAWTRGTFAMTMAHYYRSAGYSLKEAAIRADKDTSTLFVDYSSQERAMMFQRLGELGKFASTVSTFKMNNLNQWFTFSNKKMYGALATLALTSWFTTGMFGMPFGDEAEFGATWLKSKGVDIPTPREYMLRNAPEWVAFGPLSSAPRWVGEAIGNPNVPSAALHRKFAQDNVIPDDLLSFIYPLSSFFTGKIEKGMDWYKSGFAKQEGAVFARELAPGNLKYGVDYLGLTNEKGLTVDPNQIHDVKPDHYDRTKQEWKLAAILGVVSQREFTNKQYKQLDKMSEMAWKESTKRKVSSTISAFDNKDKEKFEKLAGEAIRYNPGAAEEISKYIKGRAEANNIPMEKLLEIQFAKGATTPHGVKRLQGFQQFRENRP